MLNLAKMEDGRGLLLPLPPPPRFLRPWKEVADLPDIRFYQPRYYILIQ